MGYGDRIADDCQRRGIVFGWCILEQIWYDQQLKPNEHQQDSINLRCCLCKLFTIHTEVAITHKLIDDINIRKKIMYPGMCIVCCPMSIHKSQLHTDAVSVDCLFVRVNP